MRPPPDPVIVNGYVPVVAFLFTDIVSVEVPEPATDVGLNEELVRAGNPPTLKFTVAANGPERVMVTVYDIFEPRFTIWPLGEAEMLKSATANVTCVEWVRVLLVPVIVSV